MTCLLSISRRPQHACWCGRLNLALLDGVLFAMLHSKPRVSISAQAGFRCRVDGLVLSAIQHA